MKRLFFGMFVLLSVVYATGCKKNDRNNPCEDATYSGSFQVIRDCTGTYVRYLQKDYLVCNFQQLSQYATGSWLRGGFNKIQFCSQPAQGACSMLHIHHGLVEVVCIRSIVYSPLESAMTD